MSDLLKIDEQKMYISGGILGSEIAEVWVGPAEETRVNWQWWIEFKRRWWGFLRESGIYWNPYSFALEQLQLHSDYYELDVSRWRPGLYRFNIHTRKSEESPYGTPFQPELPDAAQYSWGTLHPDLQPEAKDWLWLSPRGRGHCIRICITQDRQILPAGNVL